MSSTLYVVGFVIAVIVCGGLIWYFNHRADWKAAAKRKVEVDAAERRRNRRQGWENPPLTTGQQVSRDVSQSASRDSSSGGGDFATSMVVGYATNNGIIGGLVGGSLAGGIIGDALNTSDQPRSPTCSPAPASSYDSGNYDSGSCGSDSSSSSGSSTD